MNKINFKKIIQKRKTTTIAIVFLFSLFFFPFNYIKAQIDISFPVDTNTYAYSSKFPTPYYVVINLDTNISGTSSGITTYDNGRYEP